MFVKHNALITFNLFRINSTLTPFSDRLTLCFNPMKAYAAALAAAAFLVVLGASTDVAAERDCVSVVEQTIDDQGLDRSDIRRIQYFTRSTGRFARWPQLEVWIWFESCRGNVVIDVQPKADCRVRQVYSLGSCSLPAKP